MPPEPGFTVHAESSTPIGTTLLIGLPAPGMAGLTVTDYLVRNNDAEYAGHVASTGVPSIAPFEDGEPRHHTRLFAQRDADLTIISGELFVPGPAVEAFVDGVLDWVTDERIEEIALLSGIQYPHGPDEHDAFYVATPGYASAHLADGEVRPLPSGVLDGVAGELMPRGLETPGLDVAAFVTPSHPPGPDIDAAIRLLDAVETVSDVAVDREELEEIRARWQRYYAELADRMDALAGGNESQGTYGYPEDRAYM